MQEDKVRQAIEESLKPQRELNNIVITIIAAIIPIILTSAGKLAYDIALLFVITILVIYLGQAFSFRKKSIIDWNLFHRMLVTQKVRLEYRRSVVKGPAYDKIVADEVYNNYILFLYLRALFEENKDKFAQELWDKARMSDKSVDVDDEQKDKEKRKIQARFIKS